MKHINIKRFIDHKLSKSIFGQILLVFIFAIIVFAILAGIRSVFNGSISMRSIIDWLLHFINPATFFPNKTINEECWALIIGFFGMICLSGLLISIFNNMIARRVEQIQKGHVYYSLKNHVVIIGYDKMCIGLIKQLADKYYIVLQTIREVSQVRHELFAHLDARLEKRIVVISGNRTSKEDLKHLCLDRCKEIFILGEMDEYDNDSLNIKCYETIRDNFLPEGNQIIRCHVLFEYQSTFAVFQQQNIETNSKLDFIPFNYYETWAQKVFVERKYEKINYTPLDHQAITSDSEKHVHLVVVGMSSMGVALGIQAAHLCHFPNFITKKIKTRITFIDDHADREVNFLLGRYKHLFKEVDYSYRDLDNAGNNISNHASKTKFTDLEFEFIKTRLENPEMQEELAQWSMQKNHYLTIAVCFSFPPEALAAGLYLPDEAYNKDNDVQVLIQQETDCTLAMFSEKSQKYGNVKPFGMLDGCFDLKQADDVLPMMVKYAYDTFYNECKKGNDVSQFTLKTFPVAGENNIIENWRKWKEKDNISALKWSNRYNANAIDMKQRSTGFLSGQELSAQQVYELSHVEHNRWIIEKLLMGYRAPNPEEAMNIREGKKKEEYKQQLIHTDIKAFPFLDKDDNGIPAGDFDVALSKALPFIQCEYDKLKIK